MYAADPTASAFLAKHPEFNNRFIEQCEVRSPGFDNDKGKYMLREPALDRVEYATMMLAAASALTLLSPDRRLLEAYYDGRTLSELGRMFRIKSRGALDQRLFAAKSKALKALTRTARIKVDPGVPVAATREVIYRGRRAVLSLVFDSNSGDYVWTNSQGQALPKYAQDLLDSDDKFKEWEVIWL